MIHHQKTQILTARMARDRLAALANPVLAAHALRFFKTGKGEYGAGDRFRGLRVPAVRRVARACSTMPLGEILRLLRSSYHEDRLLALLVMGDRYTRGDDAGRQRIFTAYLANRRFVNNWDLVDASAPRIAGAHLYRRSRAGLRTLVRSTSVWDRRIAIVATAHFIHRGESAETLKLAERLLGDEHDLIHKATGWMLREVGQRCGAGTLRAFLDAHAADMPRTMLRYAIEHFGARERARYLAMGRSRRGVSATARRRT